MPEFITTTDRLLSDQEYLKRHQMDIKVKERSNGSGDDDNISSDEGGKSEDEEEEEKGPTIEMNVGVGVYDI